MRALSRLVALAALLTSLLFVSVAAADALVVVEVRTAGGEPVDGEVTLRPAAGGAAHTCRTTRGNCRIADVPGGRYTVVFTPATGAPTAPRPAMIPPDGTVTLHVAAP